MDLQKVLSNVGTRIGEKITGKESCQLTFTVNLHNGGISMFKVQTEETYKKTVPQSTGMSENIQ